MKLRTLLGDYPLTRALKQGELRSPLVDFDFADVKVPSNAFKRVVRDLEFDIAELAITTFLMARAHGKPLVLLPAVLFGRFQHPLIVYNAERGRLVPGELAGRRVGIRSTSVTTAMWIKGILADDYGVDLERVHWVTFEDAHVAEYRDPPSVERAAPGKELVQMLIDGEIDAAVVGDKVPQDPRLKPLIPDAGAAAEAWFQRTGALQINHMVVAKASVSASNPQAVREVYRLLVESKRAAGLPSGAGVDPSPMGFQANRRNLEVAIEQVWRRGLIPRRFTVEELFDDATRGLN
jgi:4,5-dihydroxyphthalate decarboxylase